MIPVRRSPAQDSNTKLTELTPRAGEGNRQWLERAGIRDGVLLLGGTALVDFRIRVAQSHLRQDLLPSYWSIVGILDAGRGLWTVPLHHVGDASKVPPTNAVARRPLTDYDDPERFPNIAILDFGADPKQVLAAVTRISEQRATVDLVSMVVNWLAFVWGATSTGNPLLHGVGLPSAAFVEAAHGILRLELTPNLSTQSSCPEAIWQAAKWWHGFYAEVAETAAPSARRKDAPPMRGSYAARQPAAAAADATSQSRRRKPRRK